MNSKELKFLQELASDRIKEKFALLENHILFSYGLEFGYIKDFNNDLDYHKKQVEKITDYLLACGYSVEMLEDFKNQKIEFIKNYFKNKGC